MSLPLAKVTASALVEDTAHGREIRVRLENTSTALAFQLRVAIRTQTGELVAPVIWSDNWIELIPGESRTLSALLPEDAPGQPVVQVDGWNFEATSLTPLRASVQ
jgi:exo-1,4-beta-D-glucosaminidase